MKRVRNSIIICLIVAMIGGIAWAQYGRGRRNWDRRHVDPSQIDPADINRNGVPTWEKDAEFEQDVFTFARVQYTSYGNRGWRGKWETDWPDSDLNFSFRLQQLTSLKVDPNGKIVQLDDPKLFDYPFIYIIEPGDMSLTEAEVQGLRRYLLNGGFLMVDDFWGEYEWDTFYQNLKRVFPDREPQELPLDHEIFHCVYDLTEKPQIPSINHYLSGRRTERWDATEAHYRGVFDDDGRMMAIICHNTDLGDGWEREGVDSGYFHEYSEKWAYPLGINIVTYAMTH